MSTHTLSTIPPPDWRRRAACLGYDPELWFPNGKTYAAADVELAVSVCQHCPVRGRCLDFAIDKNLRDGIYGGHTPAERDRIVRDREPA